MCSKSIKTEAVFAKAEMNNESNTNGPLASNPPIPASFLLVKAPLNTLIW